MPFTVPYVLVLGLATLTHSYSHGKICKQTDTCILPFWMWVECRAFSQVYCSPLQIYDALHFVLTIISNTDTLVWYFEYLWSFFVFIASVVVHIWNLCLFLTAVITHFITLCDLIYVITLWFNICKAVHCISVNVSTTLVQCIAYVWSFHCLSCFGCVFGDSGIKHGDRWETT